MEIRKPEFDEAKAMMSGAEDDSSGPALGAFRVGAELRAARLRLGWTLEDVADGLRIRLPFLAAIEEGRIGDLPGTAYALGFLRSYAQALGLNPDEVARRFRAEARDVNRKTELTFPAPVPDRGVPAGAVVLLGLVLAIGAYGAWYKFSPVRHDAVEIAAVPDRFAPLAERATPGGTSPQIASILPPAPALVTAPPAVSTSNSTPASAQAATMSPPISVPVPVPVPVTIAPPPAPAPAPPPEATRVVLKFKADAYVQIREKGGPVLLNRVMRAGESWPVPKQANLVMTTGNAGGLDVVVDGIAAAPLGATGTVRRDVSLDAEAIKLPPGVKLPPHPRSQ